MEIEWDYDTIETGTTVTGKLSHISMELKKAVTRIFIESQDYHELNLVSKYQDVFETMSFMFEDYRQQFEDIVIKRMGDLTQEQQNVEALVFCSWLSIEVMSALSNQYM